MRTYARIGFTGTRRGMTEHQKLVLRDFLSQYRGVFRHGDCKGADAEAQAIAQAFGYHVIAHPCDIDAQRAYTQADEMLQPAPPLQRNRHIVDASEQLVACPGEKDEVLRSGTWATVRYARKQGVPCLIIPPEGK